MKLLIIAILLTGTSIKRVHSQEKCEENNLKNCLLENSTKKIKTTDLNVYDEEIKECSTSPMTGYFRDGKCRSNKFDKGNHSVCAKLTDEFLVYTKKLGNDLSTPNPRYNFPGLKDGDYWCLCVSRWLEARNTGIKVEVKWDSSHKRALDVISKDLIK